MFMDESLEKKQQFLRNVARVLKKYCCMKTEDVYPPLANIAPKFYVVKPFESLGSKHFTET